MSSYCAADSKHQPMYPNLSEKEAPPAYTLEDKVSIEVPPPTLCANCSNAVCAEAKTIAPKPTTVIVHPTDFCKRCYRVKRRILKKLVKGKLCECQLNRFCRE